MKQCEKTTFYLSIILYTFVRALGIGPKARGYGVLRFLQHRSTRKCINDEFRSFMS